MRPFSLRVYDDEGEKCTFYTVAFIGDDGEDEIDETTKFFQRYVADPKLREAAQLLLDYVIDVIGNKHGPSDALLNRSENGMHGLPHHGKFEMYYFPQFPLRLYVLKLSESILVLLSGGLKDNQTSQSSSLSGNWYLSLQFANEIRKAVNDGTIVVNEDNRTLTNFSGGSDIILP